MTSAPEGLSSKVDVRDLNSVRRAMRAFAPPGGEGTAGRAGGDVILGDDWVAPAGRAGGRRTRFWGLLTLQRSPLARKIVTFNLIALILLVTGMLWLTPSRDSLALQRARALANEADLIAKVVEARLPAGLAVDLSEGLGSGPATAFAELTFHDGAEAFLFDAQGRLVAVAQSDEALAAQDFAGGAGGTVLGDVLNSAWDGVAAALSPDRPSALREAAGTTPAHAIPRDLVAGALEGRTVLNSVTDPEGRSIFTVAAPVEQGGRTFGAVAVRSATGEIDALVRSEREQVLRMFVVAVLVSVGLSLVLASTIANPLSDLAAAAESGRDPNARNMSPSRVRIPDLSARPDEIGRLSAALRGMVAALYERIEANEQFAADVAHEIKNPLASLRSAVGSFPFAKRDDQRQKLLDIIEHDVRRLDRLVSDISNASRLDSELVKEEEKPFDLLRMLAGLDEFLGEEARAKGMDFITDLPGQPVVVNGLEGRLAQVFVNLITNAISFCEEGDAIRLWARRRDNRVLVVVEDTGPGIPEDALTKIFQRFYSERPEGQFGNNSGLGLAISKQIVEAHGGVIWAENIRPTEADPGSAPLGARFVVGLPV